MTEAWMSVWMWVLAGPGHLLVTVPAAILVGAAVGRWFGRHT